VNTHVQRRLMALGAMLVAGGAIAWMSMSSLGEDLVYHWSPTALQAKAVAVIALMRWEPRLNLTRIALTLGDAPGQAFVDLEGYSTVTNTAVSLRAPLVFGGLA